MYIRDAYPNVMFEPIAIDLAPAHAKKAAYRTYWMAKLHSFKRMVACDEQGYYTMDADNQRLDIELTDILASIPKARYNELVATLTTPTR